MASPSIPSDQIVKFIEEGFEKAMPTLIKFLEIPSQSRSFDVDYLTNGLLMQTAELLKNWVIDQKVDGLKLELHNDEGFSPFLFGQLEGSTPDCQTILFYGHMDKQPPMEPWSEGLHPHKPVLRDGKLYGRGGADDGYSVIATILAIKAMQTFGLKYPRIVMLFEADEESGSDHIHHYLAKLQKQIGKVELVICLDSGCGNYDQLWTSSTLRGYCLTQFTVTVLKEGVHSGDASGVVPSSFRIARILLDRIENPLTGEIHQDFQVNIPEDRYLQAQQAAEVIGQTTIDKFPYASKDMKPVSSDPFTAYINRVWKAQLSIIGADGIPSCKTGGNVLRTHTSLKLSLRLPPTADPKKAEKTMIDLLTKDVPYGATVTIDQMMCAQGWNCPPNQPYIQDILNQASEIYFQKPALSLGEGGSIPLMGVLQGLYPESQFIVTGVLGPQSNAHGPNEFLHVPFTKKLICSLTHFLAQSYPHFSQIKK